MCGIFPHRFGVLLWNCGIFPQFILKNRGANPVAGVPKPTFSAIKFPGLCLWLPEYSLILQASKSENVFLYGIT